MLADDGELFGRGGGPFFVEDGAIGGMGGGIFGGGRDGDANAGRFANWSTCCDSSTACCCRMGDTVLPCASSCCLTLLASDCSEGGTIGDAVPSGDEGDVVKGEEL